jgi:hypothetical protein
MFDLLFKPSDLPNPFNVRVTPRAKKEYVKVDHSQGNSLIKVYVTPPPEDGKANRAVLKILSKELSVPVSSLKIISGLKSRNKMVEIQL